MPLAPKIAKNAVASPKRHDSTQIPRLRWLGLAVAMASLFLSSCLAYVESQIEPDVEVDKRLVGVWVCVPIHEDPSVRKEAEEKAFEEENYREDDDIGINGYLIFGDSGEGTLEILGVEGFSSDGPLIIKGRRAKTRSFEGRNYLLFELEDEENDDEKPAKSAKYVIEYAILDDGSLRLWFLYFDALEEILAIHKMEVVLNNEGQFGGATIRGSSDELLKFYSDPKVAKMMLSAGRYKKLEIPANARILGGGED